MAYPFFCKQNGSKWLWTVVLFINLLCFNGYTFDFTPQHVPQTQTELISSYKTNATDNFFVTKTLNAQIVHRFFVARNTNQMACLIAYNRCIKIQFDQITEQNNVFRIRSFWQIKTIPQSYKEAITASIVG